MKYALIVASACFISLPVGSSPVGEFLVNLPTTTIKPQKTLLFRIAHRFTGEVDNAPEKTLFGLDAGAKMRFSFDYSLRDDWLLSAGRTSWTGATEVFSRYRFNPRLAVQAGVTLETGAAEYRDNTGDSANLQLVYQRPITKNLQWLLVPSYASATRAKSEKSEGTTAIGTGLHYAFGPQFAVSAEWIKPVSGYRGDNRNPVVSYSLDWFTGGHIFQLLVSNSTALNSNRTLVTQGMTDARKFHAGFSISRLF